MANWSPGTRVEWRPNGVARYDYGDLVRGVVAGAPVMDEIDGMIGNSVMANGRRIPVDLDPPITLPKDKTSHPITIYRLFVREQFLREATSE